MTIRTFLDNLPTPHRHPFPTVAVTGTAVQSTAHHRGETTVTLTGRGLNRAAAWDQFQKELETLHVALRDCASVGNAVPSEKEEQVTRVRRSSSDSATETSTETAVTAMVEVTFLPSDFGAVTAALVNNGLQYSKPDFDDDTQPEVTPEMLAAAAADARVRAKAIAEGLGATIGQLVSVAVGSPITRPVWSPIYAMSALPSFTPSNHLDLDETKMRSVEAIAQVTCEFEIIETQVAA